jgi:hypothetical protein
MGANRVVLTVKARARCKWKRASGSLNRRISRKHSERPAKMLSAKVVFLWNAAAFCVGEGDAISPGLHTRQLTVVYS